MKRLKATVCTPRELADFVGRSVRRIQQMVKDGQLPATNEKGVFKTWEVLDAYIATQNQALKSGGSETAELTAARCRFEKAKADEKELDVAVRMGTLVLAEDVESEWMNMVHNFRARVLAAPAAISAQGEMTSRAELFALCNKHLEAALKELESGESEDGTNHSNDTKPTKAKTNSKKGGTKRKATTKADSK